MLNSFSWFVPAVLLVAAAGFVALGRWQLDRAEVNRAIEAGFDAAADLPEIDRAPEDAALLRFRRIRLNGHYLPDTQILLDNMTHEGRAGYAVLSPFEIGGGRLVLVNRGFVPADADRRILPDVALDVRPSSVTGRIDQLPRAAIRLGEPQALTVDELVVLSFPDYAEIESVLDRDVLPFVILLDSGAAEGYLREWGPPRDRDERNVAYAVQWFGLALLAFVLAIGSVVRALRTRKGGAAS